MIDKSKRRTLTVLSDMIADHLITKFGEEYLIMVEPKLKKPLENAYIFRNTPEVYAEFERIRNIQIQMKTDRKKIIDEYFDKLDTEAVTVDSDVMPEDDGKPKKKGRKKKVDKVEVNE